jgi:hypothetical protein
MTYRATPHSRTKYSLERANKHAMRQYNQKETKQSKKRALVLTSKFARNLKASKLDS